MLHHKPRRFPGLQSCRKQLLQRWNLHLTIFNVLFASKTPNHHRTRGNMLMNALRPSPEKIPKYASVRMRR